MKPFLCLCYALFLAPSAFAATAATAAAPLAGGPWDVAALQREPQATWGQPQGLVREVYYASEPLHGKPTRVFAYYGRPAGDGPFPAVLLVHGGGGKAFAEWAEHWAKRGYVALAMDLSGNGPAGHLEDGGPAEEDAGIFREFGVGEAGDMWTYHAVAAVLRGHGLLASRPEVDAGRVALTGISWGGYLTCIVAGLDPQLKAAVPVYGCGFLHENSFWLEPQFAKMSPERRERWVKLFDPSRYLGRASCPMLFVNGTNDFAYPLDSYQKSYRLVPAPVTVSVKIDRPHGHIWTFPEVDAYIDSALKGAPPLPALGAMTLTDGRAAAQLAAPVVVAKAELNYTNDTGPWQQRHWHSEPAAVNGNSISAALPAARPLVCFLYVTDARGLAVSTQHVELPATDAAPGSNESPAPPPAAEPPKVP